MQSINYTQQLIFLSLPYIQNLTINKIVFIIMAIKFFNLFDFIENTH